MHPGFSGRPGRVLSLAKVTLTRHVLSPVDLLGPPLIMRSASNPEITCVVRASHRARVNVIQLQQGACRAAVAVLGDVGALLTVAFEDFAPHGAAHAT
jgi:hypothetical protein